MAAARGFVDEVIKPEETREKLLCALEGLPGKKEEAPEEKHRQYPSVRITLGGNDITVSSKIFLLLYSAFSHNI